MDDDLDRMSREQLIEEVKKLRGGIREHRDTRLHDLCWHHPALWGLLPEKTDPVPVVPAWPEFIRGCIRYRQSLDVQAPDAPRASEPYGGSHSEARVARIWQGRISAARAEEYEKYLYENGIRKIAATAGNLGVQSMRHRNGSVVEFITISYWANRQDIRNYAGEDIEKPRHLERDAEYLLELPQTVKNCDLTANEWK
ncbi:MAG TPA: hypothetical protein VKD25_09225 [Burkholderiales bacterium]|nr:hypothetical protein [Burkholderiales bacterium]